MQNKLNIVAIDNKKETENKNRPFSRRKEAEARFDRIWLIHPEQFNQNRNVKEKERITYTLDLIKKHLDVAGKRIVDIGCGGGAISHALADLGAYVDAVDVSSIALTHLATLRKENNQWENIQPLQDYAPATKLKDDAYDLVICTDLIAYLAKEEHRMLFSELARLIKPDGFLICSSEMDINSIYPVQQFAELAETEFKIEEWRFSYHLCWIRLKDFFSAPARFARAWKDPEYRQRALIQRTHLSHFWFQLNSRPLPAMIWSVVQIFFTPILKLIKTNRMLLLILERFCRFWWNEAGISHALFVGKRKPLYIPPPETFSSEIKHKKQVWE